METMHDFSADAADADQAAGADRWPVLAAAWELLALSLRYPDAVLAEAVATGEWLDAAREIAGGLDLALPEDFGEGLVGCDAHAHELSDPQTLLHALRTEATRLFVGAPEPVVSPYEGVHRAQVDGVQALLFVNPHSMEVERFAKACGLGRPEGTNEPLDHVATECELLEHLTLRVAGTSSEDVGLANEPEGSSARLVSDAELPGGSPEAAYKAFLVEHAYAWMPCFAEAVAIGTRSPFYRAAASFLATLLRVSSETRVSRKAETS